MRLTHVSPRAYRQGGLEADLELPIYQSTIEEPPHCDYYRPDTTLVRVLPDPAAIHWRTRSEADITCLNPRPHKDTPLVASLGSSHVAES